MVLGRCFDYCKSRQLREAESADNAHTPDLAPWIAACAVFRYPYLTSSTAGFALQETVKRADMRALGSRISTELAAPSWDVPTLILTGEADKFMKVCGGVWCCLPQTQTLNARNPISFRLALDPGTTSDLGHVVNCAAAVHATFGPRQEQLTSTVPCMIHFICQAGDLTANKAAVCTYLHVALHVAPPTHQRLSIVCRSN